MQPCIYGYIAMITLVQFLIYLYIYIYHVYESYISLWWHAFVQCKCSVCVLVYPFQLLLYIIIYIIQGVGIASLAHSLRFTAMDINFSSVAEKDAFCGRLSSVRDLLTPTGSQTLNNYELL